MGKLIRFRSDRFDPAGDVMVLNSTTHKWSSRTGGSEALTPARVQHEFTERRAVPPGKDLVFSRSLSPDLGGARVKIDAYYGFDRTGRPILITTDEFLLK